MSRQSFKTCVEQYQKSRLAFIQTMSSFADKAYTKELIKEFNCVDLIVPLLYDLIPSIQHAALSTLVKITCSMNFGEEILEKGVMKIVLGDLNKQNKNYKKLALHMLTCVADDQRFSELLEKGLKIIIPNLGDPDPEIRASTALTLGKIASINQHLAERVVQLNALPGLTEALASPESSLKQAAAFAFDKIVQYSPQLARHVVSAGVIPLCVKALDTDHFKVKADALLCLADIAKHSPRLASIVAETGDKGATSVAVEHLRHPRTVVQKNAATLLQNICMHNLHLANLVVFAGGVDGLLCLIDYPAAPKALPAIRALGYLATQSEQIADQIIASDGVIHLRSVLESESNEKNDELQVTAAWTLGEMGKHSATNVAALSRENILSIMFSKTMQPNVSESSQTKYINVLNLLLPKCENWRELEQMFKDNVHREMLPSILCGLARVLSCHKHARRSFVQSQCLRKLQETKETPDIALYLNTIYSCFPEEVLEYLSPDYMQSVLSRLNEFQPEGPNLPDSREASEISSPARQVSSDDCLEDDDDESSSMGGGDKTEL